MNKRKQSVIILTVLLVLCLFVFTACNKQNLVNLQDYMNNGENGTGNLNTIGKLVKIMHEWIGSYGWTVVVFTVALKVVMIPFDIWQRSSTKITPMKSFRLSLIILAQSGSSFLVYLSRKPSQ